MEVYNSTVKALQALNCVLLLLLLLPTPMQSYPIYQICSPVELSCGKERIASVVAPFRMDEQPESCGRESFRLFCHGEFPAIQINSAIYWVKNVDYQSRMLTLVNMDFVGNLCPSEFASTHLDISPFDFSFDVNKVAIHYNCSCPSAGYNYNFWALPCPANASDSFAYLAAEPFTRHPYWGCGCHDAAISVALRQSEFEKLAKRGNISTESFMVVLLDGFEVSWPAAYPGSNWCNACMQSGGNCAYDRWPAGESCLCHGGSFSPVCPSLGAPRWGTLNQKFVIGIILGIGGSLIALCLLSSLYLHFCRCKKSNCSQDIERRKKLRQSKQIEAFLEKYPSLAPRRYSYVELEKMTNSFSDRIGKGGFATVYKGKLSDGHSVAVKDLSNSKSNGVDFVNEVVSIGCTYHVNIVSLLGYCAESESAKGPRRFLIYEFMPNGSLERFLFGDKRGTLGWKKLYEIAIGIARGLEYLHRGCLMSILHFDIKPHNILLDHDFCPKISDFGLAKLCGVDKNHVLMQGARGTPGYIAPEVFNPRYGRASSKSDVYSYGMMVLEMVGGRRNIEHQVDHTSEIYYPHWLCKHLDLDGNFQFCGAFTEEEKVISRRMIMVGLWCIQIKPEERPPIKEVVDMLEGRIEDLQMPSKPVLYSPPRTSELTMTTLTS